MHRGFLTGLILSGLVFGAVSSSTNYKLQEFGVNSGGTNSATSSTYNLEGVSGEVSGQGTTSPSYSTNSGSVQAGQASTPPAPTVDNGSGTYYNKLHIVIDNSANPSDATFAIWYIIPSVASGYVQADGTFGPNNGTPVYQSYSAWGGSSGTFAVGLSPNTTYYFAATAKEGQFTASPLGPFANATTVSPSLTFSVSPNTLTLGNLNSGSLVTSSTLTYSFTTNAANGGFIYVAGSGTGLISASNSNYNLRVSPPSGDLSSLSEGSGLQATGTASLIAQSPYNIGSNTVGAFYTTFQPLFIASGPVSSGSPTAVIKAKAQSTTPAGTDYTNTLTFVAAASY